MRGNEYYQHGNTVRKQEQILAEPNYEIRVREEKRRKLLEQNARRRAHKRSLRTARLKLFSVSVCIFLIGAMLFCSVHLQNMIMESKKNIISLEDELEEINTINDAAKSRIDTAVNLNNIKARAVNEMGMIYAGGDNIVYYEIDNTDYMLKIKE